VTQFAGGGLLKLFFGNLVHDWEAFVGFLRAHSIWLTVSLCLAIAGGVDHVICHRHAAHVEKQLSDANAALTKERNGRIADRQAYVKAQADAAAQNKAQVAKVEQQQQKVTDDVEARYHADLARLRAERLRQPANPAPQRAASSPASPAPGPATGGPGCEAMPLSGPDLLRAKETELQLNALIDWVLQQASVDPNK
jgi:hypothetical protein